jgi:hypothetical protein
LVGLRVRRAAARASPTLPSPANPWNPSFGLLIMARATSQTGDRYVQVFPPTH